MHERNRGGQRDSSTRFADEPTFDSSPAVGKRTLVETWVQQIADSYAHESPDVVREAATQGIAGSGHTLPHGETIQRLFGRHDVSGIVAHTDGAARSGAQAMGARAFATGHHVAFAGSPDLHTAAHEAAHVVQQRAGVHLKSGVGRVGDEYEKHADAVADRVVAGQSAEDLLDRFAGGSGSTNAAIQRAPGDPPPTAAATTPTAPVQLPAEEAYHASSSDRNPAAPPSRNATWDHTQEAATDSKAQDALDITWIDALPDALKTAIDQAFSDETKGKELKNRQGKDAELVKIEREAAEQQKAALTETTERLTAMDPAFAKKRSADRNAAIAADRQYRAQKERIELERRSRKEKREEDMQADLDGPMPAGARKDSVVEPPTAHITRLEGKALARTNFMSWAIDVLGSAATAKRHFQSIREVARQPGFYLIGKAADRFEAARTAFETAHPGYTFPTTSGGTQLRGFHQARQGIGMLGHALGVAFDLLAYDNPNQKLGDTKNYGYVLDRFGGQGDKRGRSIMSLGAGADDKIAAMGKNTEANTPSADDDALANKIRDQFNEMAATSDRLRASMTAHLAELSQGRDAYFNSKTIEKELAGASANVQKGDAIAAQRLKNEKFKGDASERAARVVALKAELAQKKQQLADDLEAAKSVVSDSLKNAFADWVKTIKSDISKTEERKAETEAELAAQATTRSALAAIDPSATGAVAQLDAFVVAQKLTKPRQKLSPAAYKATIQAQLRSAQKPRASTDPKSLEYIQAELVELNSWIAKLSTPASVFGTGYVVPQPAPATPSPTSSTASSSNTAPGTAAAPATSTSPNTAPGAASPGGASATSAPPARPAASDKHWVTKRVESDASVMQFIENGFARHDEMPDRTGQKGTQQVFNAELVTTLARYGFSPGATYRDTMHFDFIEGYGAAPGGRSMANMKRDKYGPSGDAKKPKAKGKAP